MRRKEIIKSNWKRNCQSCNGIYIYIVTGKNEVTKRIQKKKFIGAMIKYNW